MASTEARVAFRRGVEVLRSCGRRLRRTSGRTTRSTGRRASTQATRPASGWRAILSAGRAFRQLADA